MDTQEVAHTTSSSRARQHVLDNPGVAPKPPRQTARHFVSGLSSGLASAVILQPLDMLKTQVQQSSRPSLSACVQEARQSSHPVRALWKGTIPSALRTGFGSALYLTSLNTIRQHVQQTGYDDLRSRKSSRSSILPTLTNTANLMSGVVARTIAGLILMPLTVMKVRFESNLYLRPSLWAVASDIRRTEGTRGFFAGFGATAMRDAPYAGMYVVFYEMLKTRFGSWASGPGAPDGVQPQLRGSVAGSVNFASATLAGAACSALSNPFDAIKTRIQLQPRRYRNVWRGGYKMIREDGFRSLWDGLALRMSRKALSSALAWTIYEELLRRWSSAEI
ncbi:hypothetical protein CDD83_10853 [Cordyceps sp. RAO-2017]|nr:hypothetical protein CDD83_10853 [Cordyceps sp. RAO-2017]